MAANGKRKSQRINSVNLLAYFCLDANNDKVLQGMGRTLNVSEGGILLETHVPIDPQHTVCLTIAMEDDLMDFRGRIAHSRKCEDGRFQSGIQFTEIDESKRGFLEKYITFFKAQENNTREGI